MARDVSGSDPCLCALQECDGSCHAAPQIDNDLHCNHCCLRPCDDSWTDLDRDGENGISPELLHHRRPIADAVWQSDQLCALAMGHYRAGRAIRSQTHDLVVETMFLYSRLASATILQRRERTNRLLSVDAAIAHELRTPLGAIALNASTALSRLRSNPPELEEMDDILSDIEAESHRAGAIISSIRELSKKTTDRRALTGVEDAARLVLRLLQYDLQINEVSVATEFEGKKHDVCGSQRVSTVTRPYCCWSKTPDPEFLSRIESAYSIRSSRRNLAGWDWGSLSVLLWSKSTEANCGSSNLTLTALVLS
jgi:hypothetical protein